MSSCSFVFGNLETGERLHDSTLPEILKNFFITAKMGDGFSVYSIRRSSAHWAFACIGDIRAVMDGFNWAMLENASRWGTYILVSSNTTELILLCCIHYPRYIDLCDVVAMYPYGVPSSFNVWRPSFIRSIGSVSSRALHLHFEKFRSNFKPIH